MLIEQKENLKSELETLKARQEKTKISWNIIRDLEMKISNLEKTIDELIHKNKQEEITLEKHFKKEIESCGKFLCYFNAQDYTSLFSDMTDLLTKTKKEISIIDVDAVKQENVVNNESLKKVFEELNEINTKLQELEKQAIFDAKIVGTTLAKTYLNDILRERKFDTVILDEASMASIPALWCASFLAENSIVIVGDFLQLPPIVMAETPMAKKWLGKDIFYHSGMQEGARNEHTRPENFVMLDHQFRMESDIADIANMYYGQYCSLKSDDNNEKRI